MHFDPRLETAVYLGGGKWKVLAEAEARSGCFDHLPQRRRRRREEPLDWYEVCVGSC